MRKLLLLLVVGLAMMSVTRAAAVLADRQLVGFPKTTANPPFRNWHRLTVVGDQMFLNRTSAELFSGLRELHPRTLELTSDLPLAGVHEQLAGLLELSAWGPLLVYFSAVGDGLVALVAYPVSFPPPQAQFLILVDRQQWPKVIAVYPLGKIQDPRAGEGPSYLSGAAFLGDRLFLGLPRWPGPGDQLEEPLISSGLGEFSAPGLPPRNFPSTDFKSTTTDDLRFIGGNLVAFHAVDRFNLDWLTAWRERNGAWELVWKRSLPGWNDDVLSTVPDHFVGEHGEGFWVTGDSRPIQDVAGLRPPLSWIRLADGETRPWTNRPGHEVPFSNYSGTVFRDTVILANDQRTATFTLTQVGTNAVPGIVALDPETRTVLPWRPVDSLVGQNGLSLLGTERYLLIATGTDLRAYTERGAVWLDPVGTTGSELRLRLTGTQGDRVVVESSGDLRQWEEMSVRELLTEADLDVVVPTTAESRWFRARVVESP